MNDLHPRKDPYWHQARANGGDAQPIGEHTDVEKTFVTPAMAAEWLEKYNTHNRGFKERQIIEYARDMLNNRWRFTGETIQFSKDGVLLNGQNRLRACVIAGTSEGGFAGFWVLVVRGLERESQEAMDQGANRSLADILNLADVEGSNPKLASAARALVNIKLVAGGAPSGGPAGYRARRSTRAELKELILKHPGLVESVALVDKARGAPTPLLAAVHYVAKYILNKPEQADAFVAVFKTGVQTYNGDAAHALREFLLRHQSGKGSHFATRMTGDMVFRNILSGWNQFSKNEKRMKWMTPRDRQTIEGLDPDMI